MQIPDSQSVCRLFALEPLGRGTGQIESLTGYITRQAREHSISTGCLLTVAIEPLIRLYPPSPGSPNGRRTTPWHGDQQRAINGTGERSDAWLSALEQLTQIGGLSEITVRSWSSIMTGHYMLRSGAAYCADCFQADLVSGQPYDRLAWAVSEVETCAIHRRPLRTGCPRCGRYRPFLAPWSLPGNCHYCGCWLGERHGDHPISDPWPIRIASVLDDALARRSESYAIDAVRHSLATAIDVVADGNRAEFARMVGLTSAGAYGWFSKSQPSLRTLLRVAAVIGSDLPSILAGEPRMGSYPPLRLPEAITRERHRVIDWPRVQARLAAEAEKDQPTSLRSFLRAANLDKTNVRKRAPQQARALIDRAGAQRSERVDRRRGALIQELETIVAGLKARGLAPSRRNVEALLPPGVNLREPSLQAAWRRIR